MRLTEHDLAEIVARGNVRLVGQKCAAPISEPQGRIKGNNQKQLALAMSEADLQQSVIDQAHLFGYKVAHFRSVQVKKKDGSTFWQTPVAADGEGFPDLILLKDIQGLAWELKSQQGEVSAAQVAWLAAFKLAGFDARIVRPSDWFSGLVETLLKEKSPHS